MSRDKYQNLPEGEKSKKREYGREQYTNLSETEKQRLFVYRNRYYEMKKNKTLL